MSTSTPNSVSSAAKQFAITASLMIWEKLCWRNGEVAEPYRTDKMPEASGHSRLIFLNWISYCLVTQKVDQAMAASLCLDPHERKATFTVATNTTVDSSSYDFGRALFSRLQLVFQPGGGSDEDILAEYAFERIYRKLQLLDATGPLTEVGSTRLNIVRLLQKWLAERTVSTEVNCSLSSIMSAYDNIVSTTPSMLLDKAERVQAFKSIQLSMTHLIGSNFVQDLHDASAHGTFAFVDVTFMLKLHRRLWKLNFYRSGVRALRDSTGARRLRELMSSGWTFSHAWLPISQPVNIALYHDPITFTTSIFETRAPSQHPTPSVLRECTVCDGSLLMNAWRPGDVVTLRLHPEMQIMTFLSAQGIEPRSEDGTIGCSKRPCLMCAWCLDGGSEKGARAFTYTPTSRKLCSDWLAPGLIQDGAPIDWPFQMAVTAAADKVWRRMTLPENRQ